MLGAVRCKFVRLVLKLLAVVCVTWVVLVVVVFRLADDAGGVPKTTLAEVIRDEQYVQEGEEISVDGPAGSYRRLPKVTMNDTSSTSLWPADDTVDHHHRIIQQLLYTLPASEPPQQPSSSSLTPPPPQPKTIYVFSGLYSINGHVGDYDFRQCPVHHCEFVKERFYESRADAVLFEYPPKKAKTFQRRPPNQIWILKVDQNPLHSGSFKAFSSHVNWTMTYRLDADIPTASSIFVTYKSAPGDVLAKLNRREINTHINFNNKTGLIAWFLPNCESKNRREEYVEELKRHISVDVFGSCGVQDCVRGDPYCDRMLTNRYKFYLAFEHSNCKAYITEDFFYALRRGVIPIVMGARSLDYATVAPPHSYIHVDDYSSPKHLAEYLLRVASTPDLYMEYFAWHAQGVLVQPDPLCGMCALLHANELHGHVTWYEDFDWWWRRDCACALGSWNDRRMCVQNWKHYDKNY